VPFDICGLNPIVDDPTVNVTYDEVLAMDGAAFLKYVEHMRAEVLRIWDEQGIAPARGWTRYEVIEDFKKLVDFPVHEFWRTDELTGRRCIENTYAVGNSVNAWNLSRMLKTRINYTLKDDGRSIYDFFKRDDLFERYLPYARRHILRDSFFFFAQTVQLGQALPHRPEVVPQTALEYVQAFDAHERAYGTHELLIEPKKGSKKAYTGYAAHLHTTKFAVLSFADFKVWGTTTGKLCPPSVFRLLKSHHLNDDHEFHVRVYEKGQHIFPDMFKSFRVSVCQYAVNFPPLTAKLLYQTFLQHVPGKAIVWDPSAGWAGRLLGAMSTDRELHYIGTDPNGSLYDEANDTNVYEAIADFYNNVRASQSLFGEHNTAEVYSCGSEVFPMYPHYPKDNADMVFTSPPYFNREAYSEDQGQSYKKFGGYDAWREGFLRPTIQNAYDALKHDRYFLWNIADLKIGKDYLPLEQDSMAIAKAVGFEYKETILMTLRGMPGANRMDAEGNASAKNFCKVDGKTMKYEPIHVFYKPLDPTRRKKPTLIK
jgi:DNA methylase